jgi:hypothetical protein
MPWSVVAKVVDAVVYLEENTLPAGYFAGTF